MRDIGTCIRRALTGQPITEEEEAALWAYVERQAKREDKFISAVCVLSVILIVCAIAKVVLA